MNKRYNVWIPIFIFLLICTSAILSPLSVCAAGSYSLLDDGADLLTDKEESKLLKKLTKISDQRDCDIAVITVGDLGGLDAEAYVDDAIDSLGMGADREYGTATLLIYIDQYDPTNREVRIATDQTANRYFSDDENNEVLDEVIPDLSSGDYADAVSRYADICDTILGRSQDGGSGSRGVSPGWLLGDLGIGAVLATLMGQSYKRRLKTARRKSGAAEYKAEGGIHFFVNEDIFLDREVRRRRIEQDEDSRGEGPIHEAGTTHTTSSGSHHGGAGRKF